jgi:phage protein U
MFALLGEISFEVIGSPEVFESSRRFDYAEHRVVEDRPRLQWLAADLESITLAMLFHISFTDPAAQLAALLAAADDHQARALVLGNGVFRGFFVVESGGDQRYSTRRRRRARGNPGARGPSRMGSRFRVRSGGAAAFGFGAARDCAYCYQL